MTAHRIDPYGSWSSPITSDFVVAETIGLADLRAAGRMIYWIEARPTENGRNVLVRHNADGTIEDVTPSPYNVRTRVHEYGGAAYVIAADTVFFSNFADQRLYRLDSGDTPRPFSTRPGARYADGRFDASRKRLVLVREDHGDPEAEPVNTIVSLPVDEQQAPEVRTQERLSGTRPIAERIHPGWRGSIRRRPASTTIMAPLSPVTNRTDKGRHSVRR
jgi:hypothetical protein